MLLVDVLTQEEEVMEVAEPQQVKCRPYRYTEARQAARLLAQVLGSTKGIHG